MKKAQKSMAALVLAFSLDTGPGVGAEGAAAETAPAEEQTDPETGYAYRLLPVGTGEGAAVQQAEITGYTGTGTALAIPAELGQHRVSRIAAGAFQGNTSITSVTIPEGITRIGKEAFQGCESLAEAAVPSTVTDWDDDIGSSYSSGAFRGCTALTSLELAEGLTILGQEAFAGCTALERVRIPSTITEFHNRAFAGCTALMAAELPEGIRQIGYRAFQGCTALEEIDIPSTISSWGLLRASGVPAQVHDSAPFYGCTGLEKITFREGLRTLQGFQGTRGCPKITELDIPATVEDISWAFTDCESLEKITLHEGIGMIGQSAFQGCTALREMILPDTAATVQAYAFKGCTALERLVIPAATGLEVGITNGCTSLEELCLLAEKVKWYQAVSLPTGGKLYCIKGSSTYETYQAGMAEADRSKLAAVPDTGAEAEGCSIAYDGSPHPAATIKGTREGDKIRYRLDSGESREEIPQVTEPGSHTVEITVRRVRPGELPRYSLLRVQAEIRKRQYSIRLQDTEAEEGEPYEIAAQGYGGAGEVTYTYYRDADCTRPVSGKPETAGEYYVKAATPETAYDAPAESNTAKLTIRGKGASGTDPGNDPSASQKPGTDPGNDPSASQKPGTGPGNDPSASQKPGTDPGNDPSASQKPGTDPGSNPSTTPDAKPSIAPSGNPGAEPSEKPDSGTGARPTKNPGTGNGTGLAKGSVFTAGKLKYKVTSVAKGKAMAEVKEPASKKAESLTVPATVKKGGTAYAVTSVGTNAFKNCKKLKKVTIGKNVVTIGKNAFSGAKALKKITVKSTKLKKVGKNALKGIHRKAVIKVPKKKLKKYRKLWKKKGQKGTVKIK